MTAYIIFLSDNPENGMVSWQMGKLSTTPPARNSYVRTFLCFEHFLVCQRVSVDYAFRGRTDYLFPRRATFSSTRWNRSRVWCTMIKSESPANQTGNLTKMIY